MALGLNGKDTDLFVPLDTELRVRLITSRKVSQVWSMSMLQLSLICK